MIGGIQACSFIDFPGHLAAVVFTRGCNMRCGYCHNPDLCLRAGLPFMTPDSLLQFLARRKNKLSGVTISGGEPTLHKELPALLGSIGQLGFAIKLDTNGSRLDVVKNIIRKKLVNYVAVDIKMPPNVSSKKLCATENQGKGAIETLSALVAAHISCEARTTVVEGYHNSENLKKIAMALAKCKVKTWYLQPVNSKNVLDKSTAFSPPAAEIMQQAVRTGLSAGINTVIRGKSF